MDIESEEVVEERTEFTLDEVVDAFKRKDIDHVAFIWVLVENYNHVGLVEVLIRNFGIKFARRIMMDVLRIVKKQARERRLNS